VEWRGDARKNSSKASDDDLFRIQKAP